MVTTTDVEYDVDGTVTIGRLAHEGSGPDQIRATRRSAGVHQLTDGRSWRALIELFDEVFV